MSHFLLEFCMVTGATAMATEAISAVAGRFGTRLWRWLPISAPAAGAGPRPPRAHARETDAWMRYRPVHNHARRRAGGPAQSERFREHRIWAPRSSRALSSEQMFLRLPSFRATTCPPTRSISSLWPCGHDIEVAVRLFIENLVGHCEAVSQLEPNAMCCRVDR